MKEEHGTKIQSWNTFDMEMFYTDKNEVKLTFGYVVQPFDVQIGNTLWHHGVIKLMQWTGLHDKNGKDIYEGDILSGFNREVISEIVWGDDGDAGEAAWTCRGKRVDDQDHGEFMTQAYLENFEVIGNIYQDSHLLKEEQ
jgi:hypothetical protein